MIAEVVVIAFGLVIATAVLIMVWPLVAIIALGMLTGIDTVVLFSFVIGMVAEGFWIRMWRR